MKEALSKQEWIIMETLWKQHPLFLSQIMEQMSAAVDWQKSTFSTYMRKLCDNGYVAYETVSGNRAYYPNVELEECVRNESRYMISKLTDSSAKLFLTCMIKESGLSESDRAELKKLIADLSAEKDGGEEK
jgi:BlaI family penicillinase repressor